MTLSSVNAIVYYDGVIITTKHGSMFVSGSTKIVQLDNRLSFDSLKQAIGNRISLPNGKVVKDIHCRLPVSLLAIVTSTWDAYFMMMRT